MDDQVTDVTIIHDVDEGSASWRRNSAEAAHKKHGIAGATTRNGVRVSSVSFDAIGSPEVLKEVFKTTVPISLRIASNQSMTPPTSTHLSPAAQDTSSSAEQRKKRLQNSRSQRMLAAAKRNAAGSPAYVKPRPCCQCACVRYGSRMVSATYQSATEELLKWRLMIKALPSTAVAIFVNYLVRNFFPTFDGFFQISNVAFVYTAAIFVIGLLLQGVVTDYKESEKAPGTIATLLESFEDSVCTLHEFAGHSRDNAQVRDNIRVFLDNLFAWLIDGHSDGYHLTNAQLSRMMRLLKHVDKHGAAHASRLLGELSLVRGYLTRIQVIRDTEYLAAAHPILRLFHVAIMASLILCIYPTVSLSYIVVGFFTLIYSFLVCLVKDIDNPFEYQSHKVKWYMQLLAGAVDADLSPLVDYYVRLTTRDVLP